MQTHSNIALPPLADIGTLSLRYDAMAVADRARAVLEDALPAIQIAIAVLDDLANRPDADAVFKKLRTNPLIIGKIRPSEAKNTLMDADDDFMAVTRQKLESWKKTMERLAGGEGIARVDNKEFIPGDVSVAMALLSIKSLDGYLAILQLALGEWAATDAAMTETCRSHGVKIRRCATLLSDYYHASGLPALIH